MSTSPVVEDKAEFLIGYDIDGVISLGICPRPENSVIITGRSHQESKETYALLKLHDIKCPVYFAPWTFNEKTREKSAVWKAEMIDRLGVNRFFEDDPLQFERIVAFRNMKEKNYPVDMIHVNHQHNEIL